MKPVILVGSTITNYKVDGTEHAWLTYVEQWQAAHDVTVFLSAQRGLRAPEKLDPLIADVRALGGDAWTWSLDDGERMIGTMNRLAYIATGRNIIHEYAVRHRHFTHLLLLDTDLLPDADTLDKLLAVDRPLVGGEVPQYCLQGPPCPQFPDFPVQDHWNTAGYLLMQREVFRTLRWRHDTEVGLSDDPAFALDAREHNWPTYVRKDCVGVHQGQLVPVEDRTIDFRLR